jgi:PAS domain S-box-containing protein
LASSFALYLRQAEFLAEELVREKARSGALLFSERADRLMGFVEYAARENPVSVYLELGLESALSSYLSGLAQAEGFDGLWVRDGSGAIFASSGGEFPGGVEPVASAGLRALRVTLARAGGTAWLFVEHSIGVNSDKPLGSLVATLELSRLTRKMAEELAVGVALSDNAGLSLLDFPARQATEGLSAPGFVEHYYGEAPIAFFGGDAFARLLVQYPSRELARSLRGGLALLAASALACLLLALASVYYFSHFIVRPAKILAAAAREIADGKYGLRSSIRLNDELGDLARDFDRMSQTLYEQEEDRAEVEEALRQSEAQFRSIFNSVSEAIFVHDPASGVVVDLNGQALSAFGYAREDIVGKTVGHLSAEAEGFDASAALGLIHRAFDGETVRMVWKARRKNGELFWMENVLRRARIAGEDRVLVSCRDVSERKAAEEAQELAMKEKEALLREVHHRVKNNFQIINSLFDLQEGSSEDASLKQALGQSRARIHAMALVHERLYLAESLSSINFGEYIEELTQELFIAYAADPSRVRVTVEAEPLPLDIDHAIPCGLILNELVTNTLKYAFPAGRAGRVLVRFYRAGHCIMLSVEDDGIGLDAALWEEPGSRLGLTLIKALASQLKALPKLAPGPGCRIELCFPYA